MASASTSTARNRPTNSCYEVFLNHRGPDTKNTFASLLYRRLAVLHGFRVFWDKEEMQVGDSLTSQIQHAIESASIHVAIFSPRYAESKWCLDELHLMVESGKPIIPVFHHVQPTELRWTQGEGAYAQALRNLEEKKTDDGQLRYNSTTIRNWRTALSTVAEISGLELDKFNGDEGELLDKVVDSVSQKLRKNRVDVAEHPTGLNEKIEDFEKKVLLVQRQQSGKPQVIGIVGLGGIGKTTFVKEFFNRKSSHYHKSYILFDVREKARKDSLQSLQNKLLKGLTQIDLQIESVSEGIELLKTRLSFNHRVLVILDDVDGVDQLDALLRPTRDALHSDSLILITSRDKDVLTRSKVAESSIYKLTGLNPQHSRELFCWHVFTQRHPPPRFERLVRKYIEACNRLPLSLKVFGSLLSGNDDESYWEDQLERLEQILPVDIETTLQISYDALQKDEKEMFLDIACFFIGKSRDTVIRIWDASGWKGKLGFRSLQNKSLVEVDMDSGGHFLGSIEEHGRIRMHDHLRDLGRRLASDLNLPRRIWNRGDFDDLMQQSSVVTNVRGISMRWKVNEDPSFSGYKMRNLQLLDIDIPYLAKDSLKSILNVVQSPNLIWLRWNYGCYSLPSWIPMKKLRVLEVTVAEWKTLRLEESQAPLQLQEQTLQISSTEIRSLSDFFGNLTILQHINLSHCKKLESLPNSLGNITSLQHIDLTCCSELKSLPDSFGNLTGLKFLRLYHCYSLTMSSETLGRICTLEYIDLTGCVSIEILPSQIVHQRSLETLTLWELVKLKEMPSDIGELRVLKNLNLQNCCRLKFLPDSIGRLNQLTELTIYNCQNLVKVGTLPDALRRLQLAHCPELKKLEWRSPLSNLQTLDISGCSKLEQLPSIETLVSLQDLLLPRCLKLRSISGLVHLTKLRTLEVSDCPELEELVGGGEHLTSLEKLNASVCVNLQSLNASGCVNLQSLNASGCVKLQSLNASGCVKLQSLNASGCVKLQSLNASGCVKLQSLNASGCGCVNLQSLNASGCVKLQSLNTSGCVNLQSLNACGCVNLQSLIASGCVNLQLLIASGCVNLQSLSVETWVSLQELDAFGCVKLKSIWGLVHLTKLRCLDVGGCSELVELVGVEHLTSLDWFNVDACPKLRLGEGVLSRIRKSSRLRRRKLHGMSESPAVKGVLSRIPEYKKVILMGTGQIGHARGRSERNILGSALKVPLKGFSHFRRI